MVRLFGAMGADTMENSKTIVLRVSDIMFGLTEDSTKVCGKATK